MTEGSHGPEVFRGKTTVKEILEVAIGFERAALKFYSELVPKVSKRIRFLVEELAEEEMEHVRLFSELAARPDIVSAIATEINRTAADSQFSDCLHVPNLGDHPDDQAVLQYAMGREHAAMLHYTELARTAPEGPVRDTFIFLAKEETEHKTELEKIYYELIHRGGGV
ncbi:MAG TPA: ferritin family protein [Aestuariivirga sp.]|nr:ferritin family protein [Aestuariivirga sp.]